MNVLQIISYCISVASVIIAIWQTIKNANIKKYLKSEAMELYSDSAILLGNIQSCLRDLQNNAVPSAIQNGGKAEGLAQALFTRSIKNIHRHYGLTRKLVDEWIDSKKIHDFHKDAFLRFTEK